MNSTTSAFTLQRHLPGYQQIARHLRERIVRGELPPGARLPSIEQLARQFGTTYCTVHGALTPLVKEGLLERHQGVGTFVRKREKKLICVGVFDDVVLNASLYRQAVHKALKEELGRAGLEMDVWLDPRPDTQTREPWMPLVRAAEHREFQALIAAAAGAPHLRWLTKLPVPTAFLVTANVPNRVTYEMAQFAELSLQALARQGCRSVGLIAPLATRVAAHDADLRLPELFFERFVDVSRDLGLTIKDQWMRLTPHELAMEGRSQEAYGYEQFLALWRQRERPDGLVVFPDTTVRGVITALLEQSVPVPGDLKLALHKNEAVELLCPMPATFVVQSERALARALIEQVEKAFRGERCEPITLPFRLMAHRGAREQETNNQTNRRNRS